MEKDAPAAARVGAGATPPTRRTQTKKSRAPAPWDTETRSNSPSSPSSAAAPASRQSPQAVPQRPPSRPRTSSRKPTRPNPLLAGGLGSAPSSAAGSADGAEAPGSDGTPAIAVAARREVGAQALARSPSTGLRPNPLLMSSPRRDSISPGDVGKAISKGRRDSPQSTTQDIQIEIDSVAQGQSEASSFEPAIFLESLLAEEQSSPPRRTTSATRRAAPMPNAEKLAGTKKRPQSQHRLRAPVSASSEETRTPSGEPLLPDTPSAGRAVSWHEGVGRALQQLPPPANIGGGKTQQRQPQHQSQQQLPDAPPPLRPRSTGRSVSRQDTPQVVGRPVSREQKQAPEVPTVTRELAPWDGPESPGADSSIQIKVRPSSFRQQERPPRPSRGASRGERAPKEEKVAAPTFGTPATDEPRSSQSSKNSGLSSEASRGNAAEDPDDVQRERSPSLIDNATFKVDTSKDRDNSKSQSFGFATLAEVSSPKECQKVPLSALAGQTPRPPLIVRLARVPDLDEHSLRLGGQSPLPPIVALAGLPMRPCPVASEYKELSRQLRKQRALGVDRADRKALFGWYFPYSCAVVIYMQACVLVALPEYALAVIPLLVLIPAAHLLRLAWCDRLLLAAVDSCAAADARAQLRLPMGWGAGEGVFTAMLMAALREISAPQGLLLAKPERRPPRRPFIYSAATLVLLGCFRLARYVVALQEWNSGRDICIVLEVTLSIISATVLVLFGCSPRFAQNRALEADLRLAALEESFNALLDVLRPLLVDPPRDLPPAVDSFGKEVDLPCGFMLETTKPTHQECFSVRLLTQQRLTLRATLRILTDAEAKPMVCISCSLADFNLTTNVLEGFTVTDLGKSAAGAAELPDIYSQPIGGAVGGGGLVPNLSMSGWAAAVITARQNNGHQDDEASSSGWTASTASTMQHQRSNGAKDEALLHLATSMVMALGHRRMTEPLEAFRTHYPGAIIPPKTCVEEPALLLAGAADHFRLSAGREPLLASSAESSSPCGCPLASSSTSPGLLAKWEMRVQSSRGFSSVAVGTELKDSFGILRSPAELRRLCKASSSPRGRALSGSSPTRRQSPVSPTLLTPASLGARPRLASGGSDCSSDEERSPSSKAYTPASVATGPPSQPKHLALVFDTYSERSRCISLLRAVGLLPPEEEYCS